MKKQKLFKLLRVANNSEMARLLDWSRQRVHLWADDVPEGILEAILGRLLILRKDDLMNMLFAEMGKDKKKVAKS